MMDPSRISLSLISHTNAGKTTLARTLLSQTVGEVRDAAHVTLEATAYPLIDTPQGDALVLWDTPGFGDSARLVKRLRQQGNPIGWFMTQVWDRFSDQTFWLNQSAVRNTRDQADVVLYLVNAAEEPQDAGYLAPELSVLEWIGKPVIVLLNQTGPRRPREQEAQAERQWREALRQWPQVHAVLALDAFARCWVQEFALFDSVAAVLDGAQKPAFLRLSQAWQARRMSQFAQAMQALAMPLARAAVDSEPLPASSLREKALRLAGLAGDKEGGTQVKAITAMASRLQLGLQSGMQQLIAIHGLEGKAAAEVIEQVERDVRVDAPLNEGKAALMGGAVSGALTGVAADIATGGLSLGAGMLTGAVLGAFGGAGLARGFNTLRHKSQTLIRWDTAFLQQQVRTTVLRYLAVAHYGRGRGEWHQRSYPEFWIELVVRIVSEHADALEQIWELREAAPDVDAIARALTAAMTDLSRAAFDDLYPGALQSLHVESNDHR
ncbi:MAG: DUF3482 domain-containing protein [Rhodoferax sp.]|nr:DUF3482 domain-containing protein [Rhodoferax sp.]HQX61534.1 DUF3482 domain-containing protein [Burkholderiaceae bacterium]